MDFCLRNLKQHQILCINPDMHLHFEHLRCLVSTSRHSKADRIVPILQISTLRFRELKTLLQGNTAV